VLKLRKSATKKVISNDRKIEEFKHDFQKGCVALGVPSKVDEDNSTVNKTAKSIRREIIGLLQDLPKIYDDLAADSKELRPFVALYANFITSVHQSEAAASPDTSVLPDLSFLMERGNVTTYEWVHGEPPLSVVPFQTDPELACEDDDGDDEAEGGATIDFDLGEIEGLDLDVDGGGSDGGGIEWGDVGDLDTAAAGGADIDWDIVDVDDGGEGVVITLEESGNEGGVARDSDALSILDNRKTRNLILDELHELQAFFVQRKAEMATADGSGSLALISSGDAAEITEKDVEAAIEKTGALIATLSTGKLHHLQLVRGSGKYVDRLVGDLKQKLRLVERTKLQNEELRCKRETSVTEECQLRDTLKSLMQKTKVLQANVEKDISGRYNGRRVNIMGGVQTL